MIRQQNALELFTDEEGEMSVMVEPKYSLALYECLRDQGITNHAVDSTDYDCHFIRFSCDDDPEVIRRALEGFDPTVR